MEYQSLSPSLTPPLPPHPLSLPLSGVGAGRSETLDLAPVFISSQASSQHSPRSRCSSAAALGFINPLSKKYLREVRRWSLKIYCDLSEK